MMNTRRSWIRRVTTTVAAAATVLLVFGRFSGPSSGKQLLTSFAVSLLFAACISIPLAYLMPRLWTATRHLVPLPAQWLLAIAAMLLTAAAGSAAAIGLLILAGYVPASAFAGWFAGSLRVSIIITLTFGIGITAYESLRRRLGAATRALEQKERDAMEARRLATEARLASLESRVQPHFLFNTLNSIAALIPTDPAGAERMTTQLATLLRSSLDSGATGLVPLAQELETVRTYLEIERVRFGDRLRYLVESDEPAGRALVPSMSVQTVVENSVKYAVSPSRPGGTITVRALTTGPRVQVNVEDDGPGFDDADVSPGHGLSLLRERLGISFSGCASLTLHHGAAHMRVVLEVPA